MGLLYEVGDIVTLKKGHPCGGNQWEIIRLGADIKIKCKNCGRLVMISRSDFNKRVKKVIFSNEDNN